MAVTAILVICFYFSVALYLLGLLFESKKVRDGIAEIWFLSKTVSHKDLKTNIFGFVVLSLNRIYMKESGKISHAKLFVVVVLMNLLLLLGAGFSLFDSEFIMRIPGELYDRVPEDELSAISFFGFSPVYTIYVVLAVFVLLLCLPFMLFNYFYEYLSLRMTRYFVNKAQERCSYFYIAIDFVVLFVFLYAIPVFLTLWLRFSGVYEYWVLGMIITISTPVMPFLLIINGRDAFVSILTFPAAFSIFLPTVFVISVFSMFSNKLSFYMVAFVAEKLSELNWKRIKELGLALSSIVVGLITVVGLNVGDV